MKKLKWLVTLIIFLSFIANTGIAKADEEELLPPEKPIVNPISNKDSYISGTASKNATVNIEVNGKTYQQELDNTNLFKIQLAKPLAAGTKVTVYVMDSTTNLSSERVTLVVIDKVPPKTPTVNNITDKSFKISGQTEAKAVVYVNKNKKLFQKKTADKNGNFSFPIPQQNSGTVIEVYALDQAKNKSLTKKVIVKSQPRLKKKKLNVPVVRQMPELPRGCEVTSLTMLLKYTGINANKMTLAKQVKKDPTPYLKKNGKIYFGNPNYGFVGNMYTFNKPGLGVFNQPIQALAEKYKPNRIVNLTGKSFDTILNYVSAGHPVWVINTSWFSYVPSQYWQTWYTPTGKIRITYKEHSVVITGYDSKYVYFNDPLDGAKNKKKSLKSFIEGWKQFGSQAVSYY